jgi:hypothetical protein
VAREMYETLADIWNFSQVVCCMCISFLYFLFDVYLCVLFLIDVLLFVPFFVFVIPLNHQNLRCDVV